MASGQVILRKWSSLIRTADRQNCVPHVLETGIRDYAKTPGNLGHHVLIEITMLSWWESMDTIRAFAGPDAATTRHDRDYEKFLLERPRTVDHHLVEAGHVEMAP
jgi:heme-degrading monooxygenase HmoA